MNTLLVIFICAIPTGVVADDRSQCLATRMNIEVKHKSLESCVSDLNIQLLQIDELIRAGVYPENLYYEFGCLKFEEI